MSVADFPRVRLRPPRPGERIEIARKPPIDAAKLRLLMLPIVRKFAGRAVTKHRAERMATLMLQELRMNPETRESCADWEPVVSLDPSTGVPSLFLVYRPRMTRAND